MSMHSEQLARGERFAFGENWSRFLTVLDDERIAAAKASLQKMLGMDSLDSKSFIDIGSGSGLFSLAARMLGARVHSFDYDPSSVACAQELKRRHFSGSNDWVIEEGSVLDSAYLDRLGRFDIVYSWGVLHHTGQMWHALENVAPLVAPGGKLFIAIYNTQRPWTPVWTKIKRVYNWLPGPLRIPYTALVILPIEVRSLLYSLVQGVPGRYFRSWTQYKNSARGMSRWRDIVDWVGGYPFETAKPEEIFDLYRNKGFVLEKLFTCGGGLGCNEFVFVNGAT